MDDEDYLDWDYGDNMEKVNIEEGINRKNSEINVCVVM